MTCINNIHKQQQHTTIKKHKKTTQKQHTPIKNPQKTKQHTTTKTTTYNNNNNTQRENMHKQHKQTNIQKQMNFATLVNVLSSLFRWIIIKMTKIDFSSNSVY